MRLGGIKRNEPCAIARVRMSMRKWICAKCKAHSSHSLPLVPHYGTALLRRLNEIVLVERRVEFTELVSISGEGQERGGIVVEGV